MEKIKGQHTDDQLVDRICSFSSRIVRDKTICMYLYSFMIITVLHLHLITHPTLYRVSLFLYSLSDPDSNI